MDNFGSTLVGKILYNISEERRKINEKIYYIST